MMRVDVCCVVVYDTFNILSQTQWPGVGPYESVICFFFDEQLKKHFLTIPNPTDFNTCVELFKDALECDETSDAQLYVSELCLHDIIDLLVNVQRKSL